MNFSAQPLRVSTIGRLPDTTRGISISTKCAFWTRKQWTRSKNSNYTTLIFLGAGRVYLEAAEVRREKVNTVLAKGLPAPGDLSTQSLNLHILTNYIESLKNRVRELRRSDHLEAISNLSSE